MGDDERKQRLIEWLCTPKRDREPSTMGELAKRLRCRVQKLSDWKQDPEFIKRWEAHYLRTVGSPERKQTLMDTLLRTGSDADDPRHVQAAKTYLEIAEGLRPVTILSGTIRPVEEWTDEMIDAAIARHAEREKEQRLRLVKNEGA